MNREQEKAMFAKGKGSGVSSNQLGLNKKRKDGDTIMKSFDKNLTEHQVKIALRDNAKPFKFPSHQLERMNKRELINAKKSSDKIEHFEKEAKENSKTWSMKAAEDDLDDPKAGNVLFGFPDEGSNTVPLGSWNHFFESMWNQSENSIKNTDDAQIKTEILEERMNKIAEKTAPKSYLYMDEGEYYLVRDNK